MVKQTAPISARDYADAILDSTVEGIWTIGLDGNITTVNRAALALFGYTSADQMIGRNSHELVHHKKADGTPYPQQGCPIYLAFQEGKPCHLDDEVLWRADGTSFYADYRSVPLLKNGQIIGAVVTLLDNTEKRKAQAELLMNQEWLSATLRGIGDAVISTDASANPRVTYLNPIGEKLTGWRLEEARGRPILEVFNIINETTRQRAENPIDRVLREGKIVGLANHTLLIARDGTEYAIEDSAAPIFTVEQEIQGVVLVFRDVTIEKRMRAMNDNQHRWFEMALQNIPVPIYMCDPDTGVYTYGNQAMTDMLGQPFPVGKRRDEQITAMVALEEETGRAMHFDEFPSARAVRGEHVNDVRFVWKTKNGNYNVSISANKIAPLYGNRGAIVFVVQNVTALVQARFEQERFTKQIQTLAATVMSDKAKLDALINESPIGIGLMRGSDFIFEKVNKNLEKMVTPREYIGRPWRDVYPELAHTHFPEIMTTVLQTGHTARFENVKVSLTGEDGQISEEYFSFSYDRILLNENEAYGIAVHARRTTNAVLDRERLAESEQQLAAAVSVAKVGFFDWDMVNDQITFNAQMKTDWDFSGDTNLLATIKRIHPDDRQNTFGLIKSAIATGEGYRSEYRVIQSNGNVVWIEAQGRVIYNEARRPVRFFGTSIAITERKKAEDERRLLAGVVESAEDFVAMCDPNLKPFYLNAGGRKMLGFGERDIHQTSMLDFYPVDEHAHINDAVKPGLAGAGFWEGELNAQNFVSGELIPVRLNMFPVRTENSETLLGFAMILQDISVRKSMELDLRQAKEEAERANQTKSAFLANMSHEIRTPLGAILGFTDLLKERDLKADEPQQFLETISRNGKALTRIIDDILDLAKVESGKLEIETIEFSFLDLVDEVLDLFRERARTKNIFLRAQIPPGISARIVSDPTRLRQVLINIIGNAVKFTEHGGVTLIGEASPLKDSRLGLRLKVQDTGPGLSFEQRTRLFEPFVQADNSTTRRFGGTGLGLALAKRLAKALGGDVSIADSAVGSVFVVDLQVGVPREIMLPTATPDRPTNKMSLDGVRVLVADDSKDNQFLVSRILEKQGAVVDTADNGQIAFRMGLNGSYDIVLMDIQMPEMDGYEATRSLRQAGFKTPIIALTAHAMAEERARTAAAGCSGHLTKPLNQTELLDTVREFTQGSI